MSIGLGIFLSVLVAIAAWQIDKRGAWKKSLLWVGGVLLGLVALYAGAVWWSGGAGKRAAKTEVAAIQAGLFKTYWGLSLGMSMDEVRYVKGPPSGNRFAAGSYPRRTRSSV